MDKIDLMQKFSKFEDFWNPKIIAELNDNYVKVAKLKGEFPWHKHDQEDELFYVVEGNLTIKFRNRDVDLGPNEMIVVPKGVEHKPVAQEVVKVLLIEPKTVINTGDQVNDFTVRELAMI